MEQRSTLMSRGILYNLISKSLFILSAYIIHVYLGRTLGPEVYGLFGVIMSIFTLAFIILDNGVKQAVSKNVAIFPDSAKYIFYKGVYIQAILALILGLAISLSASFISSLFNDQRLFFSITTMLLSCFSHGCFIYLP